MELEKAKKICKEIIKTNMFNRNTDAEAIETVLQELDNSISKDKVKEEKEKHLDYLNNAAVTSNPTLDVSFRNQEKYVIQVLDKLLEDK